MKVVESASLSTQSATVGGLWLIWAGPFLARPGRAPSRYQHAPAQGYGLMPNPCMRLLYATSPFASTLQMPLAYRTPAPGGVRCTHDTKRHLDSRLMQWRITSSGHRSKRHQTPQPLPGGCAGRACCGLTGSGWLQTLTWPSTWTREDTPVWGHGESAALEMSASIGDGSVVPNCSLD